MDRDVHRWLALIFVIAHVALPFETFHSSVFMTDVPAAVAALLFLVLIDVLSKPADSVSISVVVRGGLAGLVGFLLAPYILSAYHLESGASVLDSALLPVYPDRLALEQIVDWDKLQEATAHLEQALRWDERSVKARRLLARVYLSSGETEAALQVLQAALAERPDSPPLWLELGDVYDNLGNGQAAIEAYEAGHVGSRTLPLAANYLDMAEVQMDWGSGEAAIALWRRVIEVDPGNLYAYCQLAVVHREMGDARNTRAFERKLGRIDPETVGIPLDFRLAEYQGLAVVGLVETGIWEREDALGMLSAHGEAFASELSALMTERELETVLGQWPEDADVQYLLEVLR